MSETNHNEKLNKASLEYILKQLIKKREIYGAVVHIASGNNTVDLISSSGNIREDSQYYIASINKLFISAITLRFYKEKVIDLNDKISYFLPEERIEELKKWNNM